MISRHGVELGAWASLLLTEGKEVQSKLRDEIRWGMDRAGLSPRAGVRCCRTGVLRRRTGMGREFALELVYQGRLFRAFQLVVHCAPQRHGNSLPEVSSNMNAND